ncbi:hypothetical protein BST81_03990 [Leptolyngbya sp. 'hensonii']|uniref:hypothetical protein n=1 Tax=Leptolyngbya sp. 'hensonii' TaxID=1922337 RepID=UPI00094FDA2E|nr:hypothetical protein [Leptolyngbya sp. 'hensonii']OLP19709.1 hypothetical protein BST81_03990 [Leptolyngbya sp. 'hensonii']
MDAFEPIPPDWTGPAKHAHQFCCPACGASPTGALQVWLNRRSPVYTETNRRKWQEFYNCECGTPWWAWSSDRPPSQFKMQDLSDAEDGDSGFQ